MFSCFLTNLSRFKSGHMKNLKSFLIVFGIMQALIAAFAAIPLMILLFQRPTVSMFKGDQRIISKVRPYILYGINKNNLPHFCSEFWVVPQGNGGPNHTLIEAITTSERPSYSTSYSTDTFSIVVRWMGDQKPMYYAYYLPSSSFVSITTCGRTIEGINLAFTISVFNDYDKMDDWAHPNERDPDSPDITFLAQFDACPSVRTVQFNTTGYPAGKWYLLFGAGYQNSSSGLDIEVDFEFTKHLLQINSTAVGTCTATAESRCAVTAPTEGDVHVLLDFKVDSETQGQVETIVSCSKYEVLPYVMYFLVLPVAAALISVALIWAFCSDDETGRNEIELTSMQPNNYTTTSSSHRTFASPRIDVPPDYDHGSPYLSQNDDHEINWDYNGFSFAHSTNYDTPERFFLGTHRGRQINGAPSLDVDRPPGYDIASEYPTHDGDYALTMTSNPNPNPNPTYPEGVDGTYIPDSSIRSLGHPSSDQPPAYESVVVIADFLGDQGDDVDERSTPIT